MLNLQACPAVLLPATLLLPLLAQSGFVPEATTSRSDFRRFPTLQPCVRQSASTLARRHALGEAAGSERTEQVVHKTMGLECDSNHTSFVNVADDELPGSKTYLCCICAEHTEDAPHRNLMSWS